MQQGLQKLGANIDSGVHAAGSTHLMLEFRAGSMDNVHKLLALGARINGQDARGWTLLMHAAAKGDEDSVVALLDLGADPKWAIRPGVDAMYQAISNNKWNIVERFMHPKFKIDTRLMEYIDLIVQNETIIIPGGLVDGLRNFFWPAIQDCIWTYILSEPKESLHTLLVKLRVPINSLVRVADNLVFPLIFIAVSFDMGIPPSSFHD